jgi:hypothetical protein
MKYLLLIPRFGADMWERFSEDDKAAILGEYKALAATPGVSPGLLLQPPEMATTVRMQDGKTVTTDGPSSPSRRRRAYTSCSRATTSTRRSSSRGAFPRCAGAALWEVRPAREG